MSETDQFISVLKNTYLIETIFDPSKVFWTNHYGDQTYEKTVGPFGFTETENKISKWFSGLTEQKKNEVLDQMLNDQKTISSNLTSYKYLRKLFMDNTNLFFGRQYWPNGDRMTEIRREMQDIFMKMCDSLLKKYGCRVRRNYFGKSFFLKGVE